MIRFLHLIIKKLEHFLNYTYQSLISVEIFFFYFILCSFILIYNKNIFKLYKIIYLFINWGLGIGDWGLGIGDWGLGIGDWANPQSPIPNPQSPIPIFH